MKRPKEFWSLVNETADGCWEWVGPTTLSTPTGNPYGLYCIDGERLRAHRVSYEQMVGPIPEGLELDHLCRNTLCVSPEHLDPVPHRVNMERYARSNDLSCKRGHLRGPENTYITPQGKRRCRPCNAERQRRYNKERKAA
jgi:hypothetical protein